MHVRASRLKGTNLTENMKGRIIRKLKSISIPTWRVSQENIPIQAFAVSREHKNHVVDVKEEKLASGSSAGGEEMSVPSIRTQEVGQLHSSEVNLPEENGSISAHDPVKLESDSHNSSEAESSVPSLSLVKMENPSDSVPLLCLKLEAVKDHVKCEQLEDKEKPFSISDFEDRCPPGGKDSIVVYTTSLRGIRKTFEDCNTIRFLLESFQVMYSERDVSMHLEYREELWGILGRRVVPPRLFIRGRYIGGADEVVELHEKGMLHTLLQGIPLSPSNCPCKGCAGMRFVLCPKCDGSRKVMAEGQHDEPYIRCPDCNENGLVKCSVCS